MNYTKNLYETRFLIYLELMSKLKEIGLETHFCFLKPKLNSK